VLDHPAIEPLLRHIRIFDHDFRSTIRSAIWCNRSARWPNGSSAA
jgi:hypothetical protein